MGTFAVFMGVMLVSPVVLAFFTELYWRRRRIVTALAIAALPALIYLVWMIWTTALDVEVLELAAYGYALSLFGALIGTGLGMLVGWAWRRLAPRKQ